MFQTVDINIVPTGEMPVVNVSQYDVNRIIRFCLLNDGETYTPTNFLKAEFIIRKVDGTLFTQETTILVSNVLELVTTEQMTACAGKNIGEIRLTFNDPDISEDDVIISTLNFILEVERSPETGGIQSESEIANLDSQIASIVYEQLDNYYTKSEIDEQIEDIVAEQVTPIVSGIVAEQVPPAVHAELGNYYTKDETDTYFYNKTETDILLSSKADVSDLPDMSDYYTKTDTDTLLAGKVSTSTLNDYYTKTQVDTLIASVSNDLTTSIDTPAEVQTVNDGGDNIPVKSLVTDIVAQQASGTPSPSNPLPITGFSSVVLLVGVNLWDEDWEVGSINEQGNTPSTTRIRTKGYIKVIPSNTYYVKAPNNIWVWGYDENKNYKARIPDNSAISNRTITIPSGVYYIRFVVVDAYGTTYNNDISINYPSTDTAYHHSTTTTVSLGQTIYGGNASLTEGTGVKEYGIVDLSTLSWAYSSSGSGTFRSTDIASLLKPVATSEVCNFTCEMFLAKSGNDVLNGVDGIACNSAGNLWVHYGNMTSVSDFLSVISGCKLVYPLLNNTSFTFTGANIPTLSGLNNIYSSSGIINSLEYFNSGADDIASMFRLMSRS